MKACATLILVALMSSSAALAEPFDGRYLVSYSRQCPAKFAAHFPRTGVAEEGVGHMSFTAAEFSYNGLVSILEESPTYQHTEVPHRFRGSYAVRPSDTNGFHIVRLADKPYRALLSHFDEAGVSGVAILYALTGRCVEKLFMVRQQ